MESQTVKSQLQVGWESAEGELFRALIKAADGNILRFKAGLWDISENTSGVYSIHVEKALKAGFEKESLVALAKRLDHVVSCVESLTQFTECQDRVDNLSKKFKGLTYTQFKLVALYFLIAVSYDDIPNLYKRLKGVDHQSFSAEIATFVFNDSESGFEAEIKVSILKAIDQISDFLSEQLL